MTTWVGFLTFGDEQPSDASAPGIRHDILLAGRGKTVRVVEFEGDGDGDVPDELAAGAVRLRCVLNRHHEDVTA